MSDLESTLERKPVAGEGRDSGDAYSRLGGWKEERIGQGNDIWNGRNGTHVPVFPVLTRLDCIMSLDVPKSESMALGLHVQVSSSTDSACR